MDSPQTTKGKGSIQTSSLRKKTSGQIMALPHGVILFKNCLDEDAQKDVMDTCLRIAETGGNQLILKKEKWQGSSKRAIPLLFYNWPARASSVGSIPEPKDLLKWAKKMFQSAYDHAVVTDNNAKTEKNFQCPSEYDPNAVYAILYPPGGSFIPHLDGAKGWVLSVSIGDSADFFYSIGLEGSRTEVRLESGDVIIFNGGQLHHGISKIHANSAPSFWNSHGISVYEMSRLNLQFRDPIRDPSGLKYDPHFYAKDD